MKLPKFQWPGKRKEGTAPRSFAMPVFKIPGFLTGSFTKNSIAIEIGDMWLKVAAAAEIKKGCPRLTHVVAEPIQGLSTIEVSQKILNFVRDHALNPSRVLISFPTQYLTARILSLPSTDPKEIGDIVELQAVKQTPYSREEITSGFRILGSDAAGYSRIFLAIAHRDTAAQYFQAAELALLLPNQISPSLEGLRLWAQKALIQAPADTDELIMLLDVDAATTEFMILNGPKFLFGRSLGVGSLQLQQGQGAETEFLREVTRTLESGGDDFQSAKVTRILVTGVPDVIKAVAALLSRELNLPSEVIQSFQPWSEQVAPQPAEEVLGKPVSFSSLTGHLLSLEVSPVNLMPPEVRMRKKLEERAKELAFMGTLFLTLVMLGSMITFEKIYKRNTYLDVLKKEYADIRKPAEDVEKLVGKMKLAQDQMSGGGGFLEVMNDIHSLVPDNIILTSVQYSGKDHNVVLRGLSPEMSAVFQFLTTLEAAPYLEMVKTRNVTKRKVDDRELSEFEIVANITTSGANQESKGGIKSPGGTPV